MFSGASVPPIDAVLAFFNLGAARSVAPTALGMANHSYLVTAQSGAVYVVKQLVHQQASLLPNDLAIQQQLHNHGIRTPRYIQAPSGDYLYQQAGVNIVVSAKIEGVHAPGFTPRLAHQMGGILARFHHSVRSLPLAHRGWLKRRSADPAAAAVDSAPLPQAAFSLLEAGSPIFESSLPQGIIHGDFHVGNLLVRSRRDATIVAILDFEEAQASPLLVDVAFGLFGSHSLACSRRRTYATLHAFLDGYEAIRPLQEAEKDNLAQAVCFVAGACTLWMWEHGYADHAAHNLAIADALQRIDWQGVRRRREDPR